MADGRLPLLRGRCFGTQGGGGDAGRTISRDPRAHQASLIAQLDGLLAQVAGRPAGTRDALATREVIAVLPADGVALSPDQLDDSRSDSSLIGKVVETGAVLLDVADPTLAYLRKKVDAYADDARVVTKPAKDGLGQPTVTRASERAVAPIERVRLATLYDVEGPALRAALAAGTLGDDRPFWFTLMCPGGYREPPEVTRRSVAQVHCQLHRLGASTGADRFDGAVNLYIFARLTMQQLVSLQAAVDCVHEVDLAPADLRDLKLLEHATTVELRQIEIEAPSVDAPSVVLLDTGVATTHPLLRHAIVAPGSVVPGIDSPEDTHGHGTQMAGVALFDDLGAVIEQGRARATHWVQSSRLLVEPRRGLAADENHAHWPILTKAAVEAAEALDPGRRSRSFVMAVTRSMQDPPLDGVMPTLWSHAVDQLAFNGGVGRLLVVAAGNAREDRWTRLAQQYPQLQLSECIHQPAQASNALTVGAFTDRTELPPSGSIAEADVVAPAGGLSPFTSTGPGGTEWPIKPDVVLEGGNLAVTGDLVDHLGTLTTGHLHARGRPLGLLCMTSEAAARAARLAAVISTAEPGLSPHAVRALIVHSATWTPELLRQFDGIDDRLRACGYGVPDVEVATQCAVGRATIVIEDELANGVLEVVPKKRPPKRAGTSPNEPKVRRQLKLYRLPVPPELLHGDDPEVELRVTLSYFAEPNKFGRRMFYGLDLKWDMQGPAESEPEFLKRVNELDRDIDAKGRPVKPASKGFPWDVGTQRRSRGTCQSDRWRGRMSHLVGNKLIAVVPVLGWWDQRKALRHESVRFALVVSVFGPGVYAAIHPHVGVEVPVRVEA